MTLLEKLQRATAGSRELSDECLLAWGYVFSKGENIWYASDGDTRGGHSASFDPTRNLQDANHAIEKARGA